MGAMFFNEADPGGVASRRNGRRYAGNPPSDHHNIIGARNRNLPGRLGNGRFVNGRYRFHGVIPNIL